jgi:hypothetical protein
VRAALQIAAFIAAVLFTAETWWMRRVAVGAQESVPAVTVLFVLALLLVAGAVLMFARKRLGGLITIAAASAALLVVVLFNALPGADWFGLLGRGMSAFLPFVCLVAGAAFFKPH